MRRSGGKRDRIGREAGSHPAEYIDRGRATTGGGNGNKREQTGTNGNKREQTGTNRNKRDIERAVKDRVYTGPSRDHVLSKTDASALKRLTEGYVLYNKKNDHYVNITNGH